MNRYNFDSYIKEMNRILGFFKQKITEVKQQNKQQIQAIANALTQNQYSTEKVLGLLQSMKASYMNWNILIANEASTGLYYSQLHNRNICLRKIKGNEDLRKHLDKNKMKLTHIKDTAEQLKQISSLNHKWVSNVSSQIDGINDYLIYMQKKFKVKQDASKVTRIYQESQKIEVEQDNQNKKQQQVKKQQQNGQAPDKNQKQTQKKDGLDEQKPENKQIASNVKAVEIQQIIDDESDNV